MNSKRPLRKAFYYLQSFSEKMKGVDFVSDVESRHEDHVEYVASTPLIYPVLDLYFNQQKINEKDAIMDVGCGKGRMLTFFSKYPFGKIGGVEYEEDILDICRQNLLKLKIYRIDMHQGDASIFDDYDEYNYFYLFNPFHEHIMEKFVENLKKSRDKSNRDIRVLYFNPVELNVFKNSGFIIEERLQHRIVVLRL